MSKATEKATSPAEGERMMEKRWGKIVVANGYAMVPAILLRAQSRLHIDCVQLAVLLHLIDHWWTNEKMPFPSKKTLASRMGKSEKTIQRAVRGLEQEGLLRRVGRKNSKGGQTSNLYDLKPLISKLRPIAKEMQDAKKEASETLRSPEKAGHKLRKKVKNNA